MMRSLLPATLLACAVSTAAAQSDPAPPDSGTVGDTTLGLRIERIDRRRATARVDVRTRAQVLAFWLRSTRADQLDMSKGLRSPGRVTLTVASPQSVELRQAQVASCVAQTVRAPTVRDRQRRPERDATGRATGRSETVEVYSGGVSAEQARRLCGGTGRGVPLTPALGHLVVIATTAPISASALQERLSQLTIRALDVREQVEGLAQGLMVDTGAPWVATYARW